MIRWTGYSPNARTITRFGYTLPLTARRSSTILPAPIWIHDTDPSPPLDGIVQPRQASVAATIDIRPEQVRDQQLFGSCVGHSLAFWLSRFQGVMLSGQFIWTEGRRREGRLPETSSGISPADGLWAVANVGVSPYLEGETDNTRINWADAAGPSLANELVANDTRIPCDMFHISPTAEDALVSVGMALSAGFGVVMTSGLLPNFWKLSPSNAIADEQCIGGIANGHCQAIYASESDGVRVLNSWGLGFADGGTYKLTQAGLANAWEILVFRPVSQ